MDPKIEIRKFQKSDIPVLNEMMKKNYGVTKDEKVWTWWYEENPCRRNYSHVCVVDGRVVAHAGGIPFELQNGNKRFTGNLSADLLSDPENRIKRAFMLAFLKSMTYSEEHGDWITYGFANTEGMKAVADKAKAIIRGPMVPRLDRLVNVTPFLRRKIKLSVGARLIGAPVTLLNRLMLSSATSRAFNRNSIEEVSFFDARFDELWEEVGPTLPITTVRSSEYLNWRYIKHPSHTYKVFTFVDQGRLKGYVVLRSFMEEEIRRGLIIDLVSDTKTPEVWNSLIAKGIDYLLQQKVDLLSCWMFGHMPYYQTFKKFRFAERPSDLHFGAGLYAAENLPACWMEPENWHFTMGDSDVF